MPTLPNIGLITPVLNGDDGVWDDKINAALTLVDAHDHTSGKGTLVPVAGLNINANLPVAGFGLDNLGKAAFTPVAAPGSGSKNLFVNAADSELYWRTAGGANVKLTDGVSINTTLLGGIVGDYSTVGAEVAYDGTTIDPSYGGPVKLYTFKDQSAPTKKWARLGSGPVRLHEFNSTVANYVELASPASLAASYTVTWPAAVPGAQSLLQMSPIGVVSTGGAGIAHDVTLVVNDSFNVSSTGKYKHDGRSLYLPCIKSLWQATGGSVTGDSFEGSLVAISTTAYYPLMLSLASDAVINTITVVTDNVISNGCTVSVYDGVNGAFVSDSLARSGDNVTTTLIITNAALDMSAHKPLWLKAVTDGSSTLDVSYIQIDYTV